MSNNDDYHWWREALEGRVGPIHENEPQCGYYRVRDTPVAIWRDGGELLAVSGIIPDDPFEVWVRAAKHPVSYNDYLRASQSGEWPDHVQIEFTGSNFAPEDEAIRDELDAVQKAFIKWFTEIQGITTQEQADKAATFAARFADIETRCEKAHNDEKKPHLEAGRVVDRKWKPLITKANGEKANVKDAIGAFLRAEEAKRIEAAAKAPEAVVAAPVKAGGMSARTVSLRTVETVEITDIKAAALHIASLENPPAEFVEVVEKIASRLLKAGANVNGAKLNTERKAA
jgi:hypothetical protein